MKGIWLFPKSRSHDPTTVPHLPSATSLVSCSLGGGNMQLVLGVRMLTGCDQQGPSTREWEEGRPAGKGEGPPDGGLLLLGNASLPLVGHHAHPRRLRLYPLSQFSFQTLGQLLSLHSSEAGLPTFLTDCSLLHHLLQLFNSGHCLHSCRISQVWGPASSPSPHSSLVCLSCGCSPFLESTTLFQLLTTFFRV